MTLGNGQYDYKTAKDISFLLCIWKFANYLITLSYFPEQSILRWIWSTPGPEEQHWLVVSVHSTWEKVHESFISQWADGVNTIIVRAKVTY